LTGGRAQRGHGIGHAYKGDSGSIFEQASEAAGRTEDRVAVLDDIATRHTNIIRVVVPHSGRAHVVGGQIELHAVPVVGFASCPAVVEAPRVNEVARYPWAIA